MASRGLRSVRKQALCGGAAKAKSDYAKLKRPNEADRVAYIGRLSRLRDLAARKRTDDWEAIDAEIRRNPAPKEPSGKSYASRLVGKWQSPRHDYLFRPDGTWTMLPEEESGMKSTHGTWRIEGNRFFDSTATEPPSLGEFTIILLTDKDFVFADDEYVFYETRLK